MVNSKIIGIVLGAVFLGVGYFVGKSFKSPTIEFLFFILGLIVFSAVSYLFFKLRDVLFIILGAMFTLGSYGTVLILWDSHPKISSIIFPFLLFLAVIFFGIGAFKMVKHLFRK